MKAKQTKPQKKITVQTMTPKKPAGVGTGMSGRIGNLGHYAHPTKKKK